MAFGEMEDLKQLKTDVELKDKCNDIIDGLEKFTKMEKYRILTTVYGSFIEMCSKEGIGFIEVGGVRL